MEDKRDYYDSDYKLQIYEMFGKPKGLIKETFVDECKKIIAEFEEHKKQSDLFLKEYSKEREFCSKCGERNSAQTFSGYILDMDKKKRIPR